VGSPEDRGNDYQEPLIEGFSEKAIFQRGLLAIRRASCSVTLIWVAVMVICGVQRMLSGMILSTVVWFLTVYFIDVGQRALALAIETEEERREARDNYEKLSNEICLRKFKEGKHDE